MASPYLSSARFSKPQGHSYCMKCLELLDMINLWEVGVDGAARNFIRIRRELACVISSVQRLEELSKARNKDNSNEEERGILAALKNSAEKAMEISHKAASACFQKTKHTDNDMLQNTRGHSFTESCSKPVSRVLISSFSLGAGVAQVEDITVGSDGPKRPFSVMVVADDPEDLHSSNCVEVNTEDHSKKGECKKTVGRKADYTQWTLDDPPEHKPEDWQPRKDINHEPYHTHLKSASDIRSRRSKLYNSHSIDQPDKITSQHEGRKRSKSQGEEATDHTERCRSSVSPTFSDASDSDLQLERIMAKIANLEEERLNLMHTIEILQSDNVSIRQSLRETLGTLEMKDVQLKLAMQDLGIATTEIKKASELNGKLKTLERERNVYVERLAVLEDETSAVKLSLIQLLQDKSAVNKHLALENSQLHKQLTLTQPTAERPSIEQESSSSGKEEQTDVGPTIHKQGFLVKRGGRVRTWKKRLFVLDSAGLSYYKTEQPIQSIPLNQIVSASVSRELHVLCEYFRVPYFSHLFEIQTASRTYLCGASTHEEMQSWVGILQTLTQYYRQQEVAGANSNKESSGDEVSDKDNKDQAK